MKTWPEGGPSHIWEAAGIGDGYSTVAIVGQRIYTTGAIDGDCIITSLDMDGKQVWTRKNGNMALVKPTDAGFELAGKLKIEDPGEHPTWAFPVVCGGRLYIRYGDKLGVYHVAEGIN